MPVRKALYSSAILPQFRAEIFIAFTFLRPGKMHLPKLLGVILVRKHLTAELLARQVEHMPVYIVVAVKTSVRPRNPEDPPAENVLHQKRSDRALA